MVRCFSPKVGTLGLVALAAVGTGCAEIRDREADDESREACPGYDEEIQPILNVECLSCHGPAAAEGGYSVYGQSDVWARNADGVLRVMPGRDGCLFLRKARDGADGHPVASAKAIDTLSRWIVPCEGNPLENDLLHPQGWVNRDSPKFHGKVIRDAGWSFGGCEACHGPSGDPGGGTVRLSCRICHANGPTSCETCHGTLKSPAPPPDVNGNTQTGARGVGAHRAHLVAGPTLPTALACNECHVVPQDWRDPGHIFNADGTLDNPPAEVVLGPAAARSLEGLEDRRGGPPSYDANAKACTNVYCHGGALGDASLPPPIWTMVSDEPACDRCHGSPPAATHARGMAKTECVLCHRQVVDALGKIVDASLHGDGRLTLGDGSNTCHACHGSPESPAPPPGLDDSPASLKAIGGHGLHTSGGTFGGKYGCEVCHQVPTGNTFLAAVNAPGHIDTLRPAEVFPGGASFAGLAARNGATPVYDRDAATCTGVYCHGGGATLGLDTSGGILRTLPWTDVIDDTVQCGSCHGLPPAGVDHPTPPAGLACAACHPISLRTDGSIIIRPNGTSVHADGVVE
jgi:predicted CxxxxCH...CXXCH cytochrome family protein